ncbi:MAG TPA: hypothetical protein VN325_04425 [Steroidobacteraceae bacterium]|nr:hypothetical protein [Steroidobacteraceae bacterium]
MVQIPINSVAFFQSLYDTTPSAEYSALSASRVIEMIAPEDGPRIMLDKAQTPYFVPCLLAVAPYVSKTAKRYPPGAVGKQRSAKHVTESPWFPIDFDGISSEDKDAILAGLDDTVYCAFSTFRHGEIAGKVRMRVLLFMDRALGPAEWEAAWHVINEHVLDSKADPATSKMHQAAAVWAAHPDRVSQCFRHVGRGDLLSADELLKLTPNPTVRQAPFIPKLATPGAQYARYKEALQWLDAGDYQTWRSTLMSLRASVEIGELNDEEARELWLSWSATAPMDRQTRNDQSQYAPDAMWDQRTTLTTRAQILVAALFKRARDEAERYVRLELPRNLSPRAVQAATYLRRFHPSTFEKLRSAV